MAAKHEDFNECVEEVNRLRNAVLCLKSQDIPVVKNVIDLANLQLQTIEIINSFTQRIIEQDLDNSANVLVVPNKECAENFVIATRTVLETIKMIAKRQDEQKQKREFPSIEEIINHESLNLRQFIEANYHNEEFRKNLEGLMNFIEGGKSDNDTDNADALSDSSMSSMSTLSTIMSDKVRSSTPNKYNL